MNKINETKSYITYEHEKVLISFYKTICYSVKWYSNTIRIKYDYTKNNILNEFIGSPHLAVYTISNLDDKTPEETLKNNFSELLKSISNTINIEIKRYSKSVNTKKDEDKFFCKAFSKHKVDKDWEI